MSAFLLAGRRLAAVVVLLLSAAAPAAAQDRLCDPAERDADGRDCRDSLIQHIRAETVGLDIAFWFLEDSWIGREIIARKDAGVPVRMLVDTRANRSTPLNAMRLAEFKDAGIPMGEKTWGGPVRLITEPVQYRDPVRQYHSWNIDRMYMAGVEIRDRAHEGLNHQKSVQLYDRGATIFGSSNWSSASSESQEEHNLFTSDPRVFQWFTEQFERKWNNSTGLVETAPFVPLPRTAATAPAPAYEATDVPPTDLMLRWSGGYWAHKYDVFLGTSPGSMTLIAEDLPRLTSGVDYNQLALGPLVSGTTYYWRVVSKTMANMTATSSTWTFTTSGTAPAAPEPLITLVREPYLQQVTPTSAVVVWATREPGDAEVRLTDPSGATRTVAAERTLYPAAWTGLAADYYQYEAPLTGLSAATTYTYDIIVSGEDLNTLTDSITTAPAMADATVTFVAFGDSGTGSTGQQQVASLLASETFDFAMHAGDIAYANTSGTGPASFQTMDDWFFRPYAGWLRNRPMFPSMGNHDSRSTNADGRPYLGLYALSTAAATAEYPDHAERYYSFDYGPVHVIVLDTEFAFQDPARRAAQLAWADADLAATTKPWKVALYHRSAYSAGGENGSELPVREAFGPLFDRHGVHLALSAHEHDYERTLPLRAGVPEAGGTTYVVTGGGGGPLYPSGYAEWTAYSASVHHYLRGTATACTLTLNAVGLDGVVFDSVSLRQCAAVADDDPPQVSITAPSSGASVRGIVTVTAAAIDNVEVAAAELLVNGIVVLSDTQAPFSFAWDSTAVANGDHDLAVRATDAAGNTATSAVVRITVANGVAGAGDIVLYAAEATVVAGNWIAQNDVTAAGGRLMRNPNAGAAKRTTALAEPADYFELTFTARENVPYRLWMRGKAEGNVYYNDSAFVQFSGATDYAIGTTAAAEFNLEDCSGCRVAEWGWQDNGWGIGVLGPTITFTSPGPHTIRVQPREDGLSIDQIMLSPSAFLDTAPGALKNDSTIYPRSTGEAATEEPPVADTESPSVSITAPAAGATVSGVVPVTASASDTVGVARVEFLVDGGLAATSTASPFSFEWDTAAVANGSYSLTARAVDAAGNATVSEAVAVTVDNAPGADTTAPTVSITAPAAGATVSGQVSVTVAADDAVGVTQVELLVDGVVAGTSSAAPFTIVWDTAAAAEGTHTLQARAYDAAANGGASPLVTLTVDNIEDAPVNGQPSVTITSPADGSSFAAPASITVAASASDGDGSITTVEFYAGTTLLGSATSSPYEITWTGVADGTYTLTARAVDNAGAVTTSAGVTVTVAAPEGLPAGWASQDIGAVGLAGSATADNGTYTLEASGADIWGTADGLHYAWQRVSGDVDVVARVASVDYVHAWTKAGVMIRETFTAGSAHALMLVSPGKGLAFQRRLATGGLSTNTSAGAGTAPAWVKLERRGNTVTAFRSADGVNWTLVGSDTFAMGADVHVGLALTSHDNTRLARATFDGVSVIVPAPEPEADPNAGPANVAPTVSLTSPAAGATFTAPASLTLTASASDSDGTIGKVEFYAGSTLLGTATVAPYETAWTNVAAGTYTLTVKATDDDLGVTTSAPVTITVEEPSGLAAPWTSQDIGAVGASGAATTRDGTFTIAGAGADIWGTADAFQYVWQPVTGDVDIIARVSSVEYVHAWVKAGVMIRESLDAASAHALMLVSPGKGLAFQRRLAAAGLSTSTSGGSGTAPAWVKLERRGTTISAYRSGDGVNWTFVGADTFTMATQVHIGLAVSSHVSGHLATATFEQVTVVQR